MIEKLKWGIELREEQRKGENLKIFIEERKIRREELECITGWKRATMYRKLKGESKILDEDLEKIDFPRTLPVFEEVEKYLHAVIQIMDVQFMFAIVVKNLSVFHLDANHVFAIHVVLNTPKTGL